MPEVLTGHGCGAHFSQFRRPPDRETRVLPRFFPGNPENFGTKIFCGGCVIRSTAKIAVNTVVTGSVGGQEAFFPLRDHLFLPDGL